MTSGDDRAVIYSAFDKPVQIDRGLYTTVFRYGPDRRRFEKTDVGPTGTTVTTYIGDAFYEEENGPSGLRKKHYIAGVAVVIDDGAASETHYLLRDHLGSVETITDENATVIERTSFDSWGKRRAEDWTALANPAAYISPTTPRGFTGHEMLDGVGLVHMGGRVYEPVLGRFLTADPVVQDATNTQALNRYSYVLNNPLSYTDPSGFFFKSIARAFKGFVSGVFNGIESAAKVALRKTLGKVVSRVPYLNISFQIVACANPSAAVTCPAYAGAATLSVGGSLGDAVVAAGVAYAGVYAFGTVGQTGALVEAGADGAAIIGAQGAFGFSATLARGGSVREGVIAGAAGVASGVAGAGIGGAFNNEAVAAAARIATGAVIGGLAAEAAGGSFANGAATGAFAALFGEIVRGYYAERAADANTPVDEENYLVGPTARGDREVLPDDITVPKGAVYKVPDRVNRVLEKIFGEPVATVTVYENSDFARLHGPKVLATTRRETIYLAISGSSFLARPQLVLHEYYHVIRQWRMGVLTEIQYIANPSKYETPAVLFAKNNVGYYNRLLLRDSR